MANALLPSCFQFSVKCASHHNVRTFVFVSGDCNMCGCFMDCDCNRGMPLVQYYVLCFFFLENHIIVWIVIVLLGNKLGYVLIVVCLLSLVVDVQS
jgi:hypothetical protein